MDTQAVTYSYMSPVASLPIKDLKTTTKVMTLTDNETILDLNVKLELIHWRFSDLKIELIGPDNVKRVLCNAGKLSGMGVKTVVFDDDGSAGSIRPVNSLGYYDTPKHTRERGKSSSRTRKRPRLARSSRTH